MTSELLVGMFVIRKTPWGQHKGLSSLSGTWVHGPSSYSPESTSRQVLPLEPKSLHRWEQVHTAHYNTQEWSILEHLLVWQVWTQVSDGLWGVFFEDCTDVHVTVSGTLTAVGYQSVQAVLGWWRHWELTGCHVPRLKSSWEHYE